MSGATDRAVAAAACAEQIIGDVIAKLREGFGAWVWLSERIERGQIVTDPMHANAVLHSTRAREALAETIEALAGAERGFALLLAPTLGGPQ